MLSILLSMGRCLVVLGVSGVCIVESRIERPIYRDRASCAVELERDMEEPPRVVIQGHRGGSPRANLPLEQWSSSTPVGTSSSHARHDRRTNTRKASKGSAPGKSPPLKNP
ncbi:hypothetical protein BJV78DRAFT_1210359 [Lactifluus subvellereus]|nr:hypothetical protein BJV78DRAFT_1210359 [Lactifluus subvellereus]